MMSDDDLDLTLGSDDEIDIDLLMQDTIDLESGAQAEKRAHLNELERKRRDQIKDCFTSLKEAVPTLQNKAVASRAQILKQASEYIQYMMIKNNTHLQDIQDFRRQNNLLKRQIQVLEKANRTDEYVKKHNKHKQGGSGVGCSRDLHKSKRGEMR